MFKAEPWILWQGINIAGSKLRTYDKSSKKKRKQQSDTKITISENKTNKIKAVPEEKLVIVHLGISHLTLTAAREEAKSFSVNSKR